MKTNTIGLINRTVAIALIIAMACPYAYAADVGMVTYVEGRVDVAKIGSDMATPLREGDLIAIGDAIRTKSNSKAEVTFNDKSMLRLAQSTRVEVRDYVLDANNKRKTAEIMVDRGKARTVIAKMPDKAEFNISTPNARGTVKGSDVFTSFQAGSSNMLVAEGQLSIVNPTHPGSELIVPAGNSVVVPLNEAPQASRAYLELEKKMNEQDTFIPSTVSRNPNATTIKGVLVKISGDVRLMPKGSGSSRKATVNDVIGEGDTIETGADGLVEISFENGNGMNLSQNTKILITRLSQDPKTSQYENKFDISMGKVKSRIEKLKETKSTFEVRTPTAVCGARATLMYIEITPTATRVFFEGGLGDLHSLISGLHQAVEMGHISYADNDGKIGTPYVPSEGERMSWTSNWDPGNGTEGYSSSGEAINIFIDENGVISGIDGAITEAELQEFFNDPLFLIVIDVIESLKWSADIEDAYYYYRDYDSGHVYYDDDSYHNGIVGAETSPFASPGTPVDFSIAGETYPSGKMTWWGNLSGSYADDGSDIPEGFIAGCTDPKTETVKGILVSLFVDIDGNAGIIKGTFDGGYYSSLDMWDADGSLTATVKASGFTGEYSHADNPIDGYIKGSFGSDGNIDNLVNNDDSYFTEGNYGDVNIYDSSCGHLGSYTSWLVNDADSRSSVAENWGIYIIELGGLYSRSTVSDDWKLALSGNSWRAMSDEMNVNHDYWFASVNSKWSDNAVDGTKWSDNLVVGPMEGIWVESASTDENPDAVRAGSIHGNVVGDYIEVDVEGGSGTWTAVAAGEWVEVTDLLDQTKMFGENGLSELDNFVNVPITQVYSNLLTAGADGCMGGVTSAAMNISLYAVDPAILNGIWTALISGAHNNVSESGWTANLINKDGSNVTLTTTTWNTATNQWVADVTGTVGGNNITNGQAGGTFNDSTFTGVGAGTWENQNNIDQQ